MLRCVSPGALKLLLAISFVTNIQCKSRSDSEIATGEGSELAQNDGQADLSSAGDRFANWSNDRYLGKIQPIFAKRCASCHGCTSSPCNLKLDSYESFLRGANIQNYYAAHLDELDAPLNAIGAKGFFPVTPVGPGKDLSRTAN